MSVINESLGDGSGSSDAWERGNGAITIELFFQNFNID